MKRSAPSVFSIVLALIWVFSAHEPVVHESLAAQALACEATPSPPLPPPPGATVLQPPHPLRPDSTAGAPAAPRNLRIVQALEARTQATAFVPGSHAYFVQLASRPDCLRAYSLRQAWQLATRENGGYSVNIRRPPAVTYDPQNDTYAKRQDAAKIVIPTWNNSLQNQVRLPIPTHGLSSLFVTWDVWFGAEWRYDVHGNTGHKTWQFGSPKDRIHTEVGTGYAQAAKQGPGTIATIGTRQYADGGYAIGPNITGVPGGQLKPQAGNFLIRPEMWTRLFAYFKAPAASGGWWEYSLWAADADTGPVLIFDGLQIRPSPDVGNWEDFWLEYNSSCTIEQCNRSNRPPLVAYARNVVMLKGTMDVTQLLQRP